MALALRGASASLRSLSYRNRSGAFSPFHSSDASSSRRLQVACALHRSGHKPTRTVSKRVSRIAAVEEQTDVYDAGEPVPEAETEAIVESSADDVEDDEDELDYLDEQQEELLKWAVYLSEAEQEEDLDEMEDYDDMGDEEYEDIWEQVEDMIEQYDDNIKDGDKVLGTVYEVDDDGAYVEIGGKMSGFVPLTECSLAKLKTPLEVLRPGMRREFVVVESDDDYQEVILSLAALEATVFWQRIRQFQEEDITVYATVASVNRGGLLVNYHHLQGFVPISHLGPSVDLSDYDEGEQDLIGYELPVKFLEIDEEREKLVFSNKRASSDFELSGFKIGDVVVGVVQSVKPYGAFIDLGGATGLLHISQISHERVTSVETVLQEGDKLKVMILSQDRERGRVTLSTKKLEPTPGDMIRDPQKVFDLAEDMAGAFRERVAQATEAGRAEQSRIEEEEYAY